jgi:hypothetical protein
MRVALVAASLLLRVAPLFAQNATPNAQQDTTSADLPRVFLDCQASGCDFDFFRTELTWMNFVRDRNAAQVHIIVTDRTTSGGGLEFTLTFTRQRDSVSRADTIVTFSQQGATRDELRRILARTIAQGMLPYVRQTPLASRLSVVYQAPRGQVVSATRGARDRWNLWVFRISSNGFMNGDANYKSAQFNGSIRASRTTAQWKTTMSFGGNYRENSYTLSDSETFVTYQHSWNSDWLLVKSLGEHWSVGQQTTAMSSIQSNQDLALRFGPAIEYDVFPYSQSTRQQVVLRWGPGVRLLNYRKLTIYDKMKETHPDHRLLVASDITRPWGNIGGSVSFNQFLHDMTKRSADLNAFVSWRIVTGLNFNVGGGYSQIRDQLNLERGELTDSDILLRLRQLQTGYSYYGNVGLSYTFGSVFQNVVNPRFSQGGGGFFFFF